eukprot:TRINITY_DN6923_c0_g1_i1.p1 TRINITY_DN6923_c0_g1~~TRINITY_DN6923_c0_g1_i1.p1  ORF type:complete len:539 (-),score=68.29 TRINITY_DN6923_c0_g1_i1:102-1718(-)
MDNNGLREEELEPDNTRSSELSPIAELSGAAPTATSTVNTTTTTTTSTTSSSKESHDSSAQDNGSQTEDGAGAVSGPRRFFIGAIGSRGDVQPAVALGVHLQTHGHTVSIGTEPRHREFVEKHGLTYVEVKGSIELALAETDAGREMTRTKPGLFTLAKIKRLFDTMFGDLYELWYADLLVALRNGADDYDCIILGPMALLVGTTVVEKYAPTVPLVTMQLFAVHPTVEFQPPGLEAGYTSFFQWMNTLKWKLGDYVGNKWYLPLVKPKREELGLPPIEVSDLVRLREMLVPALNAWSNVLVPMPHDWHRRQQVVGEFILPPGDRTYVADQSLVDFISGEQDDKDTSAGGGGEGDKRPLIPPIYIGFGSMMGSMVVGKEADDLMTLVIGTVRKLGLRVICLSKGWDSSASAFVEDKSVCFIDNVPHDWLFPQCSVIIHHGGAGTTHTSARSGAVPIVCPFGADQYFWGEVLEKRGCSPSPIPRRDLTAPKIATAVKTAIRDAKMKARCKEVAAAMKEENGVETARVLLEEFSEVPKWQ